MHATCRLRRSVQSSVPRRLPPAALVLSVLALLLASAAPPAHAQSEVILIGNLTVEGFLDTHNNEHFLGYESRDSPHVPFGALSTTHFQHQSARREVLALFSDPEASTFNFLISTVLSTTELNTLKSTLGLVVGGRTYDFADAGVLSNYYFWWPSGVPPGWTDGARVIVKLVHKPAAPGGLTATPSYDEGYPTVALDWNDPADPMVGAYELRWKKGTDAWGEWQEIQLRDIHRSGNRWSYLAGRRWPGAENAPEYLDPGAAYTFEVRARNEGGLGPVSQQTATTLGDADIGEHGDLHISRSSDTLHEGGAITYTLSRPSANAPATIGFYLNYPYSFKGLISSDDFPAAGQTEGMPRHACYDDPDDPHCLPIFTVTLPLLAGVSPQSPQTRQIRIQYKSSGDYVARAVAGGSQGVGVKFATFNPAREFTEYYKTRISGLGTTFPFTIEPDNPGAPAGLSATAGDGEVTLAWDRLPQKHRDRDTIYEYRVTPPSDAEWAEIPDSSSVTDGYAVTGLTGGTSYVFEVRVAQTGNSWKGPSSEVRETPLESPPGGGMRSTAEFGATFHDLPAAHDGETPFTFELRFTEEVEGLSYRTLRDHAFEVDNGRVRGARRLAQGSNQRWEITVAPDGRGDVAVTLPGERACGAVGAVCTADGRRLSNSPSATVPGPPPVRLTADFHDLPFEHDGETPFTFELRFSEDVEGLSYKTLRDDAFTVTNGRVSGARRLVRGSNERWEITVVPDAAGDIVIELPAASDCAAAGAVCTADGRPLAVGLLAQVLGPAALTVADARVEEGAGAVLAFGVQLSRATARTVTVDYQTADGSAQAGADYTAAGGTLTFQPGETGKTVEVAVLDDAHDEGEETLTLSLSNASGGRLADGEATGTIENHDPLPRALLARFGRAAAVHVVEHVEERMAAPREPGFRGRFAGRQLRRGMERDMAVEFLGQLGGLRGPMSASGVAGGRGVVGTPRLGRGGGGMGMPAAAGVMGAGAGMMSVGAGAMGSAAGPAGAAGPMSAAPEPDAGLLDGGLYALGLGGDSLLAGSAFSLNRETGHGGILSFWSRGAQSSFYGREGTLALDGAVRTTMFGTDYARGPLVVGLSVANSRGLGGYDGVSAGRAASAVTGFYPWLGYRLTERVSVWGVTGYGAGGLTLTPKGGPALESGLTMKMAAAGARGELVAGGPDGFGLAFKADALRVATAVEGVDGPAGRLAAAAAAVSRVRAALEGSRGFTPKGRVSLTPSVEVGLRHDAGDAEQGAGIDVGGGLTVSDASTGLAADVRVRMLLAHEAEGFRERGMSVSLSYNPTPQTPLGLTARVAPSWGGQAASGAEALWGRETMAGMAHGRLAQGSRLDGEVGYGLPVGSRFVGTPRVGFSTSEYGRDYRVGYALGVLQTEGLAFELGVDAQRRERPSLGGADNGVLGRASVGW